VLLDCHRDGRSKIGWIRLGQRLGVSRSTAMRIMLELQKAGYVRNRETMNGKSASYELFATSIADDTGQDTLTSTTVDTGLSQTGIKSGADQYQNGRPTSITGDTQSIRSLDLSLARARARATGPAENKDDDARQSLLDVLARCPLNGTTPQAEADRLIHRLPGLTKLLIAHLNDALRENHPNPIAYADPLTQRGESPKPLVQVA
jgi:hypothetical protein